LNPGDALVSSFKWRPVTWRATTAWLYIEVCGVDCSAYTIFCDGKVLRAAAFAAKWHQGQFRRSGEPYVTHCIEAALILAALLPSDADSRRYVNAVVACILHDVVDDTLCQIEDVRVGTGENNARHARVM
jgi:(p)ppGpp synthase/HD superfamily hydrolase